MKSEWMFKKTYQELNDTVNMLIKKDECMKFYNKKPLSLETDASGVVLVAGLLQARDGMSCPKDTTLDNTIMRPIAFAKKSLSTAETCCSNIEREALGILCSLQKCHHYYFVKEVHIITDQSTSISV